LGGKLLWLEAQSTIRLSLRQPAASEAAFQVGMHCLW
jgi:hypothetical protein